MAHLTFFGSYAVGDCFSVDERAVVNVYSGPVTYVGDSVWETCQCSTARAVANNEKHIFHHSLRKGRSRFARGGWEGCNSKLFLSNLLPHHAEMVLQGFISFARATAEQFTQTDYISIAIMQRAHHMT